MAEEIKHYGLVLTLGGAPAVPHRVVLDEGTSFMVRPDRPTPVGGPGELSLETAQFAAKHEGTSVDLVELSASEIDDLRDAAKADRSAGLQGASSAAKNSGGESEDQAVADEIAAATGKPKRIR